MTILHGSEEREARVLRTVGLIVIVCAVVAGAGYYVFERSGRPSADTLSLIIEAPYVGQGVQPETPVMMHGVKVGEITSIASKPGGGVRMEAALQPGPTRGLTNALQIDYRPANYFGITGINLMPGEGGLPLRSGMQLNITPQGNFSLQALLYRLGELSHGVFDERLIRVFDRATRYADGLNPLLETVLIVGDSVAKVQTVSTQQLLRNATGMSVAFPSVIDAATSTANTLMHNYYGLGFNRDTAQRIKEKTKFYSIMDPAHQKRYDQLEAFALAHPGDDAFFDSQIVPVMDKARTDLFGQLGKLESEHSADLTPLVDGIRGIVDTVPEIFSPENFAETIMDLRGRFERIYGSSPDGHSLQVRIVLDRLPGVAAPLAYAPDEAAVQPALPDQPAPPPGPGNQPGPPS